MKINRVEINGYGKLSHQNFDFNQFQAILGKNEAGKTTMINFIKDMLFGFTNRRASHPYAPKDKGEMGGLLYFSHQGTNYIINRTEGKNGGDLKFTDENDLALPADLLKKILGPINRNTFDNLFYFGAPDLTEVGKLSKDELETRIRQVGVVGIQQWLELKKSIEKEVGDLYKQRGKKPELNQALNEYQNSVAKLAEAQKSYDEFIELNQQYQTLNEQNLILTSAKETTFNQLRVVQEDEQYWNNYASLEQIKKEQVALVPGFTAKDMDQFNDLANKLAFYQNEVTKLKAELEESQLTENPFKSIQIVFSK
ncbi:AAA family ATPase [Fructilactobacillus sp. Tb1]|uniref:AAA family ATPase n=1 Tax=Fructilactobacillus sp. Tb1 TaxID=3422304 RepID=UPI003D2882BF